MPAAHFLAASPAEVGLNRTTGHWHTLGGAKLVFTLWGAACRWAITRIAPTCCLRQCPNIVWSDLEPQKVQALFERAQREVNEGLLPACQVAIARNGKIGAMQTFGRAVQGGVEKPQKDWGDRKPRLERFAQWRLAHTPGAKFVYHISANFWPIAEIVERLSGQDYRDFVRTRIAEPLGLPDLRVGISPSLNDRVADLVWVGAPLSAAEYEKMGLKSPRAGVAAISEEGVLELNEPVTRAAASPSAGGITTAGDIALFYQALLNDGRAHDGTPIWQPEMLREARRIRTGDLKDPYLGILANRALGIAIAGADGRGNMRGFGRTNSAASFGHPGFGGQTGWADPATGISFGYLTNGFDRTDIREGRRQVALSSLAAACAG